jgi:hypothetical protein
MKNYSSIQTSVLTLVAIVVAIFAAFSWATKDPD